MSLDQWNRTASPKIDQLNFDTKAKTIQKRKDRFVSPHGAKTIGYPLVKGRIWTLTLTVYTKSNSK